MKLFKIAILASLLSLVACGEKTEETSAPAATAAKTTVGKSSEEHASDHLANLKKLLEKRKLRLKDYQEQAAKIEKPAYRKGIEAEIEKEKVFIKKLTARIEAKSSELK